jgi:transcriptional regulator with XRE-family HTH domain
MHAPLRTPVARGKSPESLEAGGADWESDLTGRQPTLGTLLRGLRMRNDWTLKEMSQRSGIPVSTLSKIEHDRLTLSYDKLLKLSQRLNIRISDFFSEPTGEAPVEGPAVTARRSIGRLDEAVRVETANYDYYYMCPELRRKRMVPIVTRIRSKSVVEFGELVRHLGEEYIYVLKGPVEVHTEFYEPVMLQTDESIYIDSTMGHAYVVPEGHDEALVLGVCSSVEEGLLESLMNVHGEDGAQRPAAPPARKAPSRTRTKAPVAV